MSKIDGRKIPHQVRESIRMQAVQQWLDGISVPELSELHATHLSCVYLRVNRYKEGGFDALKTRPIHGRPPKLNIDQQEQLTQIISLKNPTDFGFYKTMWTRDIVASVIKTEFNVSMHPAAVGKMLRRWGLSPQRPVRKAWQQDQKK
ncbi:helix-turn-helix domain-containing protein [Endozoicomonas montiporae]|uniref:helix-turn-helix domain-containing protein n=1 Tax=Endozoicomonas montiporae TaxID=1027273 RepID=UPI00068A2053|nr:winged helix-turn-helix domain-containing protein [Endozoicomonas montiporae]